jgi:hypothetical protein
MPDQRVVLNANAPDLGAVSLQYIQRDTPRQMREVNERSDEMMACVLLEINAEVAVGFGLRSL